MKKYLEWILIAGGALVGIGSVFVHPFGNVKGQKSDGALLLDSSFDPQVIAFLQKSCQNCHSDKTEWPWYSYVAPMSWMIESDVQHARNHMNLSHWNGYNFGEKEQLLLKMSTLVRNRAMPLPRYVLLHPDAKMSDAEAEYFYRWARAQRKRLKAAALEKASGSGGY